MDSLQLNKSPRSFRGIVVWQLYRNIWRKIVDNSLAMDKTSIILLEINKAILGTFDKKKTAAEGIKILKQGIFLPESPMVTTRTMSPLCQKLLPMVKPWARIYSASCNGRNWERKEENGEEASSRINDCKLSLSWLPKTTLWYQRKQQQKKVAGECIHINTRRRAVQRYTCRKWGKEKSNQTHQ